MMISVKTGAFAAQSGKKWANSGTQSKSAAIHGRMIGNFLFIFKKPRQWIAGMPAEFTYLMIKDFVAVCKVGKQESIRRINQMSAVYPIK